MEEPERPDTQAMPAGPEESTAAPGAFARFADTFIGVLVDPRRTFATLASESETDFSRLAEAFALVTIIGSLDGLRTSWQSDSPSYIALTVLFSAIGGLFLWLSAVAAPAITAGALGRGLGRIRGFATCAAWSFLPWLFLPALSMWTPVAGLPATATCGVLLFVAMVRLFWIAIEETFDLTSEQIFYFVFVIPQLVVLAVWTWTSQLLSSAVSLITT